MIQRATTMTGSLPLSKNLIRAHQPGSEPIDIPETIPNPVVVTQAITYSDRTRSQGTSSDPGEGSLARDILGRFLQRASTRCRAVSLLCSSGSLHWRYLDGRRSCGWLRNEIVSGQAANQNNISRIVSWEIDNGARHGEVVQSD
jgi:hypothetical protein